MYIKSWLNALQCYSHSHQTHKVFIKRNAVHILLPFWRDWREHFEQKGFGKLYEGNRN